MVCSLCWGCFYVGQLLNGKPHHCLHFVFRRASTKGMATVELGGYENADGCDYGA
jgi:hypothetical protein